MEKYRCNQRFQSESFIKKKKNTWKNNDDNNNYKSNYIPLISEKNCEFYYHCLKD